MKDLTLARLKNTSFSVLYSSFLLNKDMDDLKYQKILSLATIFINSNDKYIKQLGYRIIIIYSNRTNDYKPLYEVSINLGINPVAKFIQNIEQYSPKESLFTELNLSFVELYKYNNVYFSEQQKQLMDFYVNKKDSTIAVIAPTSYGKTDLIISTLRECKNKNICIVTPTKSLLAQTKTRIMNAGISWIDKIVTHPEMYNDNDLNTVAVLTQERLLRLLKNSPKLSFDYVIIDEAHGLLNDDDRNIVLASVIIVMEKRNKNTVYKFLTPFICDSQNLHVKYADFEIESFEISEYIKTERLYIYNIRDQYKLRIYDQFLDDFFNIKTPNNLKDEIDFIEFNKADKNIIYLNKPVDIEDFSTMLLNKLPPVLSDTINEACQSISEYMHPKYALIDCLKKGIIYHHGSVPDNIRIYIEHLYSVVPEIKYVITSSTLLEGVNLPAEKMFILDNKKGRGNLSQSNFKNLIGRICRFSEIFSTKNGSLKKLEPSIYLVVGKYYSKNADVEAFLRTTAKANRTIKDKPENVLLENTSIDSENRDKLTNAEEFIENYENGIIKDYDNRYTTTEIGKSCFLNNISEIDIFSSETQLQSKVDIYHEKQLLIDNTDTLFKVLYKLFFSNVIDNKNNQNLTRFQYPETRNFYKMFLEWRINSASYGEMISSFLGYWKKVIKERDDTLVYVGRWGDTCRSGFRPLWTDIKTKSDSQKINLAIVRIKDEQDFLDNTILKFIEVLNDIKLIEESLFLKIKYGTDDLRTITLVKNGISLGLANLLIDNYIKYLHINLVENTVSFDEQLINEMFVNGENQVMLYEVKYFLSK